jgi:hypothetical protein
MLVCLVAMVSCKKDNSGTSSVTTTSTMNVADLPASVTTYIADNYPDATVFSAEKVANSQASYIVTLSTEEQIAFDRDGNWLGDGQDFHHDGDSIPDGDGHHHGHGHPGHGCPGNWINIDSLPGAIKAYIATNYPDYQIRHAEKDSLCPYGRMITVMIRKPGTHPPQEMKLFFDLADNFIMFGNRIRYKDLPQAVRDTIAAHFADIHKCERSEQLTLADATLNFSVFLDRHHGEHHPPERNQRIVLMPDGTVICEQ